MNERAAVRVRGGGRRAGRRGAGAARARAGPACRCLSRSLARFVAAVETIAPLAARRPRQVVIHPLLTVLLYLHARGVTHRWARRATASRTVSTLLLCLENSPDPGPASSPNPQGHQAGEHPV